MLTVAGGSPHGCCAVVTHEALALVADVQEVAGLSQAPGADLAAAAAIQDQGGPAGAAGGHPGAVARSPAQLGTHLQRQSHRWFHTGWVWPFHWHRHVTFSHSWGEIFGGGRICTPVGIQQSSLESCCSLRAQCTLRKTRENQGCSALCRMGTETHHCSEYRKGGWSYKASITGSGGYLTYLTGLAAPSRPAGLREEGGQSSLASRQQVVPSWRCGFAAAERTWQGHGTSL